MITNTVLGVPYWKGPNNLITYWVSDGSYVG